MKFPLIQSVCRERMTSIVSGVYPPRHFYVDSRIRWVNSATHVANSIFRAINSTTQLDNSTLQHDNSKIHEIRTILR